MPKHSSKSKPILYAPGWVIFALATGAFTIGTTEFATMSLLPYFAKDLGIDSPTAGHVISAYALGVIVGAPVLTVLAATVQTTLHEDPFSGHVFVFRGRKDDRLKVLWWSGDGMCLLAKRLENGHFVWPSTVSGCVHLTSAQLSILLEGIDWRRPVRTHKPTQA